jgi:hypothetical protein
MLHLFLWKNVDHLIPKFKSGKIPGLNFVHFALKIGYDFNHLFGFNTKPKNSNHRVVLIYNDVNWPKYALNECF